MLRISKLTDYAMLIMSQMAKEPHSVLSATELAELLRLRTPTVSKILKMLAEANLVKSIRGAEGGYHLAQPAAAISVAAIIIAMEGELAVTECCERHNQCGIESACAMKDNWRKINALVKNFLNGLSIMDMSEPLSLPRFLDGT